ncbi:MAG: tRNA pseudouridine(55) synthase TruB [Nitrospirae bacterium]|nr:tRNA pseudouridine(55) synthase TruB [Nitrospirota bacterium]
MNIVLNFNKNSNITSRDAVTAAKRLFKVRKAGHAGTLDPIATGVLLICFNEATKITGYLSDLSKEYIVTAKLGEATDTYDTEGAITRRVAVPDISRKEIEATLQRFTGDIEQTPPMFSAIKMNGRPLYELARKGIEVERRPRVVVIHSLEILEMKLPYLRMKAACSKGTYIRSLCNDIGNALGVGAHVFELVRTRIGDFTLENAAALDELPNKTASLHTIDDALKHLRELVLEGNEYTRAINGNPVSIARVAKQIGSDWEGRSPFVRLRNTAGKVFGIGKVTADSIKIERLFNI